MGGGARVGARVGVGVGEENGREENTEPNVLLATSLFSLDPWNPFLASLEIREWKETPSHARASFLGGIGFIGPNAPFA